jgi:glycosyltransferase involved in cell wall biosynthesis
LEPTNLVHQPKLKIAILSREYPPDTPWGGISTVYYNLANSLCDRGHEVHVICQAVGEPRDFFEQGVFVHRVGTDSRRYSGIARINYSLSALNSLKKLIRNSKIDVVDASMWGGEGFLFSLRRTAPLVIRADISAQDMINTKTYSGIKDRINLNILRYLENVSVKRSDRIIASSQSNYDQITKSLRIDSKIVDLIHLAIDTSFYRFYKSNIKYEMGISDDAHLLLSVGRLERRKGTDTLCRAMPSILQKYPKSVLVLVGNDTNSGPRGGSYKDSIIKEAENNGYLSRIMFVDRLTPDRLVQLYSSCDVYISASEQESFGLTVIESMSCNRPVVATPVGVVLDLLAMKTNGLSTVSVGNSHELAAAVSKFLSMSDIEIDKIGLANRQLVENEFSRSNWTTSSLNSYRLAIRSHNTNWGKMDLMDTKVKVK